MKENIIYIVSEREEEREKERLREREKGREGEIKKGRERAQ